MSATCHLPATWSWHCPRTTRPSYSRTFSQRSSLNSWKHIGNQELWLREWTIIINMSKSTAILFAKAGKFIPKPQPAKLIGPHIHWVDTFRYHELNFDKRFTCSTHISQVRKKAAERVGMLKSPKRQLLFPTGMVFCCTNR